jgi:hypothetical protein
MASTQIILVSVLMNQRDSKLRICVMSCYVLVQMVLLTSEGIRLYLLYHTTAD